MFIDRNRALFSEANLLASEGRNISLLTELEFFNA